MLKETLFCIENLFFRIRYWRAYKYGKKRVAQISMGISSIIKGRCILSFIC